MAAQRATAWGEVARRLAHEIKNPLTPIRLAAERLEMRLEDKLQRKEDIDLLHRAIATITTQVDALKQMVNDFREYAKIPAAKLSLISLNDFLTEAAQLYHDADVPVRLKLDERIPGIEADPAQLRQVLHNLISNSVDATEGDRPEIVIETKRIGTDTDGSAVLLRISDNGVGFSSTILEKAFEPYVTTKETGTGLGLPMVKKILDEHDAQFASRTEPIPRDASSWGRRWTSFSSVLKRKADAESTIKDQPHYEARYGRHPRSRRRTRHTQRPLRNFGGVWTLRNNGGQCTGS